ncbi:MAG: DUF4369 domain-containing protein [Chitinophagaceae bacterium]|nr:MAG: DUF4369 domain-containing protein [Chitinophagaceae bacterium]
MYSLRFIILIVFLSLQHCLAKELSDIFKIEGQFTELPINKDIYFYLYSYNGNQREVLDSVKVLKSGAFTLKIEKELEPGIYEVSLNNALFASIILTGKEESLQLEASYMQWQTGYIQPGSSKENELLKLLRELVAHRNSQLNRVRQNIEALYTTDPFYNTKRNSFLEEEQKVLSIYNVQINRLKGFYRDTYTAEVICPFYIEPVLSDFPELAEKFDNEKAFLNRHYFFYIDFTDNRKIQSPLFYEKVHRYFEQYTHPTLLGYKSGLEYLLSLSSENENARNAVLEISKSYFENTDQSDLWSKIYEKLSEQHISISK